MAAVGLQTLVAVRLRLSADQKLLDTESRDMFLRREIERHLVPDLAGIVINYAVEIHLWIQWNPGPVLKADQPRPPSLAQLYVRDEDGQFWPLDQATVPIDINLFHYMDYHLSTPEKRRINTNNLTWLKDKPYGLKPRQGYHIRLQAPPNYTGE